MTEIYDIIYGKISIDKSMSISVSSFEKTFVDVSIKQEEKFNIFKPERLILSILLHKKDAEDLVNQIENSIREIENSIPIESIIDIETGESFLHDTLTTITVKNESEVGLGALFG